MPAPGLRPAGLILAVGLLLAAPAPMAAASGSTLPAAPVPAAPVPAAPVPAAPAPAARPAVTPTVTSIPADTKVSAASVTDSAPAGDVVLASVSPRSVSPFQIVGATWKSTTGSVTFQVRTLTGGAWSAWSQLDPTKEQDGKATRNATEPLYVGDSTGVELRAVGTPGSAVVSLAASTVTSPKVAADASLATVSAQSTSLGGVAQPGIISRAGWGADESLRGYNGTDCLTPRIDDTVKGAVIHHTAGSNSYSASQSASIVRGIYAYHVQANGWCDIGYNFLVDMYGQIFEGRYGGITLPVHGAHATSWNTDTVGVSFMMDSNLIQPTTASMNAAEALLAWKLGNSYRIPDGWTTLVGASIPVMFGHRDVMQTDCPGNNLYARIQELRNTSTSLIGTRTALYNLWMSMGGDSGTLGGVHEVEHPLAGGSVVTFVNGAAYQRPDGQVFWLGAALNNLYQSYGGPTGVYGWPTSSQFTVSPGDDRATFQGGDLPVQTATTTFAGASHFVPVTPVRLLDTRRTTSVAGQRAITLQVAGVQNIPADASAVSLNVTVTNTRNNGFVTVWPTGGSMPVVSNLNFVAGQTVPNLTTVKVGSGGTVSLYNSAVTPVDLVVDIGGYYATGAPTAGGGTVSVTPARILDTRVGLGSSTAIPSGGTIPLQVTGGTVPADAVAVLLNLTVAGASMPGYLSAYPSGAGTPLVSNVNFVAGQTTANLSLVKVGTGGKVTILNGSAAPANVVADVMGYVTGSGTTGAFHAADQPVRILDTRLGNGRFGPILANQEMTLQVTGRGGVPTTGVTAVVLNLTVTDCTASGYVSAYASGTSWPGTSNLNYVSGTTAPNQVVVAVGADGAVVLHNAGGSGSVQLIADV
ncbi:MAG TPA: peptidoglycan recognition protein, partial [Propionibacteriaceae bacterium]|nr:peptidoglycan recognition protein [Propionibacteriaceae bacterium]